MWRTVVRRVIVYTDMWIGTIWKSDFSVSINIRSLFFFILVLVRVQYINVCRKCLTLQRFFDDPDEIQFEHTVRIMKFYTNTNKIHWQTYQKLVFSSFIFVVVVVIRLVFVFGAIAIRGEQWILFCSSSKWIVVTAFLQFYARLARCIPWKLRNIECVFFRRSFAMQKKKCCLFSCWGLNPIFSVHICTKCISFALSQFDYWIFNSRKIFAAFQCFDGHETTAHKYSSLDIEYSISMGIPNLLWFFFLYFVVIFKLAAVEVRSLEKKNKIHFIATWYADFVPLLHR